MKATGIVRRIDDLGRVVIPKEIRKNMRIKEGDALEIFTDKNGIVSFKKYSPLTDTLPKDTLHSTMIFLKDALRRDIYIIDDYDIIDNTCDIKQNGTAFDENEKLKLLNGNLYCLAEPFKVENEIVGRIVVLGLNELADCQKELVRLAASIISSIMAE